MVECIPSSGMHSGVSPHIVLCEPLPSTFAPPSSLTACSPTCAHHVQAQEVRGNSAASFIICEHQVHASGYIPMTHAYHLSTFPTGLACTRAEDDLISSDPRRFNLLKVWRHKNQSRLLFHLMLTPFALATFRSPCIILRPSTARAHGLCACCHCLLSAFSNDSAVSVLLWGNRSPHCLGGQREHRAPAHT